MIGLVLSESLIDGKYTLLGFQNQRFTGEVNWDGFFNEDAVPQMWKLLRVQSTEGAIHTAPYWTELRTVLFLPGFATLIERGGNRILAYWTTLKQETSCGLNLQLDSKNRIIQVDFVDRPAYCTFAETQRYVPRDVYRLVRLRSSFFLMEYTLSGEVWFPCYMREEIFYTTEESRNRHADLKERFFRGDISPCEYYVALFEGFEYNPEETIIYELRIDPGTVKFNEKLLISDFEINIPPGTDLVNKETLEIFTTAQETWLERHAHLLIIITSLAILGGATVAGWRYWFKKI